jgi:hypothetical protein
VDGTSEPPIRIGTDREPAARVPHRGAREPIGARDEATRAHRREIAVQRSGAQLARLVHMSMKNPAHQLVKGLLLTVIIGAAGACAVEDDGEEGDADAESIPVVSGCPIQEQVRYDANTIVRHYNAFNDYCRQDCSAWLQQKRTNQPQYTWTKAFGQFGSFANTSPIGIGSECWVHR